MRWSAVICASLATKTDLDGERERRLSFGCQLSGEHSSSVSSLKECFVRHCVVYEVIFFFFLQGSAVSSPSSVLHCFPGCHDNDLLSPSFSVSC